MILALLGSVLFIVPAQASDFKPKFIAACKADGDSLKACECRYKALKKPKNTDEQELVIAVLQSKDSKVETLVKKANNWRSVAIINSMTRGLFACQKS
ncbi:MAG: hypothetical protein WBC71_00845 [Salaquimonas sp.]